MVVEPRVAVMVVAPTAMAASTPWLPATLLTVAKFWFEEFHVTWVVKSCVLELV